MRNVITEPQARNLQETIKKQKSYYVGEIHPYIFENGLKYLLQDKCHVAIIHLGEAILDRKDLVKIECPICNKTELVPYQVIASVLSGANTINASCNECGNKLSFNDNDYYHYLRDILIQKHNENTLDKDDLKDGVLIF